MTFRIQPIYQINQRAKEALIRELGVVDANRFLGQFRVGDGNYTVDRKSLFQDKTVREIVEEIKGRRNGSPTRR